ncbi:3-oxoacyl-[acyl-carrier-protein] reductase FabG [bioreactor metagenome]|uniref:3-oxoacyl-[acyl-carrier-protein] reductase FabG n=1 Tax=bioreactor metagenome TaxID=1076179 RepID=A0A645BC69_9ZZZZ
MKYQRRKILLTGDSRGIGRELLIHFLEGGAEVIGLSRSEQDLEHPGYYHFRVDLSDIANTQVWLATQLKTNLFQNIDYLINNAGVASMNHSLLMPQETVERIFRINFESTCLFCRELGKTMVQRRQGRIVNFSSVAVPLVLAGEAAYAASKCAVETYSKVFAREVWKAGVTCNCVGPAPIATALTRGVPQEKLSDIENHLSLPRSAESADVINIVDFFLQDSSELISGQILYLGVV